MDGLSVNIKFYTELVEMRDKVQLPSLIDIGICSLHVIHGAFKTGIESTNWEMKKKSKRSFQLLHDLSACRADTHLLAEQIVQVL